MNTATDIRLRPRYYLLLALALLASHALGSNLHLPESRVVIFWTDFGILTSSLLLVDRRNWPIILAVAFSVHLLHVGLIEQGGWLPAFVFSGSLILESYVGAFVLALITPVPLRRLGVRELTVFTVVCVLGATLCGSAVDGATATILFGAPLGGAIVSIWFAKIVGAITVSPAILWWALESRRPLKPRAGDLGPGTELALLATAAALSIWFTVGPPAGPAQSLLDFPYALLVVMLWAVVRFDMRTVSAIVMLVVLTTTVTATLGGGPFVIENQTPRTQVFSLQVYLLTTVAASYFLMAIVDERNLNFLSLVRSAGMHRALTEHAVDMTLVLHPSGRVRYLSPSIERVMGYALSDLPPGGSAWDVVHPDDLRGMRMIARRASALPTQPASVKDIRIRRKDGTYRYIEGTMTDLCGEPGIDGIVINCRDVTERKAAEAQIIESEQRFRMIAEAMPIPIFVSVLETGKFLYGNHHALETLGVKGSIVGRSAVDFFENVDRRALLVERVKREGHIRDFELTLLRENGSSITGSVSGQAFEYQGHEALISAFFDITQRKAAEEALRDSEDRYRALIEGSFQGIAVSVDGVLMEANNGFAEMMGYDTPEEMTGLTPGNLIAPGSVEKAHRYIQEGATEPLEVIGCRKDGSEFPMEIRARSTFFRGKPARITAFRDVSERVLFAAQKTRLEAQLRQSQKMESIGTLAGGIAHDFNNILLPIIGYAELTRDELANSSTAGGYLDEILGAAKRARDLVGQILQFSRHHEPELKPVRIEQTVADALKLLRATTPATIELIADLGSEPVSIMGDQGQIHQIVLNLGTNSAHAIGEEKGEIRVSLTSVHLDPEAAAWTGVDPGPYARLTFADNGPGIAPEVIDRIFDPFFTTKGVGRGTGLGLSAVHGIVMSHGGEVRVRSEPGRGATFEIYLPLAGGETERRESPAEGTQLPLGTERILFVDDEQQVTELADRILKGLGYEVSCVTDSVRAAALFSADPDAYDLVFTDQTMPHLSGLDLVSLVHEKAPDTPVILATGFSESVTEERLHEHRVDALLMKPYGREDLAVTIREVLDRSPRSRVTAPRGQSE